MTTRPPATPHASAGGFSAHRRGGTVGAHAAPYTTPMTTPGDDATLFPDDPTPAKRDPDRAKTRPAPAKPAPARAADAPTPAKTALTEAKSIFAPAASDPAPAARAHAEASRGYARVAVARGVDRYPEGLTYAVPADFPELTPGAHISAPLGRGDTPTPGVVIDLVDTLDPGLDPGRVKPLLARAPEQRPFPAQLVELARWIAGYYVAPIGVTLAGMLPGAVRKQVGRVSKTLIDLPAAAPNDVKLTKKQRAVVEALEHADARPVEMKTLAERAGLKTTGSIKRLVEKGVLVATKRSEVEAVWGAQAVDTRVPDALTDDQQTVLAALVPQLGAGFSTHLLYGVTGSGKTEVYIRLMREVVEAGKVALMLVPEIALTPQTGGRLIGRFGDRRVAVLHSGLTAAQRHQQWELAASGRADIVLGARSAVFAPIPDGRLGLVVVDEEHDSSYKQDSAPRYHGRDVAIKRGQLAGCPVVLGSATPSLESWRHAGAGRFGLHRLPRRAPGAAVPLVQVVDFQDEMRTYRDRRVHLLGPTLREALGTTLDAGGQAILLLNRRGYANYIACASQACGWVLQCDDCDVTMVYHSRGRLAPGGFVRCHRCQAEQRLPQTCPVCAGKIVTFGLGTQRVEDELIGVFPELNAPGALVRVDSDTMQRAAAYHETLTKFGAGEIRVLLGTQMIAKGLDFPNVRLVGVVNADTALNLPDFRASERTFQLVSQVVGRTGRGVEAGLAIVQSFQPEAPAVALAARHDYVSFATQELATRERAGLPPATRMLRVVIRDEDAAKAMGAARALAARAGEAVETLGLSEAVRIERPAPCAVSRVAGRARVQVEMYATSAGALPALTARLRATGAITPGERMAVDMDPVSLL